MFNTTHNDPITVSNMVPTHRPLPEYLVEAMRIADAARAAHETAVENYLDGQGTVQDMLELGVAAITANNNLLEARKQYNLSV